MRLTRAPVALRIEQLASAPERQLTKDELAAVIREPGDMVQLLDGAGPERKTKIYGALGMRLTYHSDRAKVLVSEVSSVSATP